MFGGGALNADGTKVFGYLTVPEDSKIGVCAHELGHLLFGWPDLYDTDESSSGLGNWCLMAGGSWNGDGDIPAHPSAWCKSSQNWVTTVNRTTSGTLTIAEVKTGKKVYRLWKDGINAQEYFLVEHRARTKYDAKLPGEGLLVYHVDDSIEGNDNEHHPQVKLIEADGRTHLKDGTNRGDAGDAFPGTSNNANFTATTTPNSLAYSGLETCVSLTGIVKSGASFKAKVSVSCPLHVAPPPPKPATRKATNTRKTKKTKPTKPTKKAKPTKKTRPTRKESRRRRQAGKRKRRVEEDGETLTMQVVENWSHVVGRVEKWTAPKDADGHGELVVRVERVADVKGEGGKPWPNLLDKAEGSTLRVQVPGSAAAGLDVADGDSITVDVRRGREPGVVFANPERFASEKPGDPRRALCRGAASGGRQFAHVRCAVPGRALGVIALHELGRQRRLDDAVLEERRILRLGQGLPLPLADPVGQHSRRSESRGRQVRLRAAVVFDPVALIGSHLRRQERHQLRLPGRGIGCRERDRAHA